MGAREAKNINVQVKASADTFVSTVEKKLEAGALQEEATWSWAAASPGALTADSCCYLVQTGNLNTC